MVGDPSDPRLDTYEGLLPGFDLELPLDGRMVPWLAWLESHGYGGLGPDRALATEPDRPAELSASAFLSDTLLSWIDRQDGPWFAQLASSLTESSSPSAQSSTQPSGRFRIQPVTPRRLASRWAAARK